jgi:hypothetical protein
MGRLYFNLEVDVLLFNFVATFTSCLWSIYSIIVSLIILMNFSEALMTWHSNIISKISHVVFHTFINLARTVVHLLNRTDLTIECNVIFLKIIISGSLNYIKYLVLTCLGLEYFVDTDEKRWSPSWDVPPARPGSLILHHPWRSGELLPPSFLFFVLNKYLPVQIVCTG